MVYRWVTFQATYSVQLDLFVYLQANVKYQTTVMLFAFLKFV